MTVEAPAYNPASAISAEVYLLRKVANQSAKPPRAKLLAVIPYAKFIFKTKENNFKKMQISCVNQKKIIEKNANFICKSEENN